MLKLLTNEEFISRFVECISCYKNKRTSFLSVVRQKEDKNSKNTQQVLLKQTLYIKHAGNADELAEILSHLAESAKSFQAYLFGSYIMIDKHVQNFKPVNRLPSTNVRYFDYHLLLNGYENQVFSSRNQIENFLAEQFVLLLEEEIVAFPLVIRLRGYSILEIDYENFYIATEDKVEILITNDRFRNLLLEKLKRLENKLIKQITEKPEVYDYEDKVLVLRPFDLSRLVVSDRYGKLIKLLKFFEM